MRALKRLQRIRELVQRKGDFLLALINSLQNYALCIIHTFIHFSLQGLIF